MKAVIMAGGFGTRIQPLTINLPKPMIPLINRPIMLHIIDLLKKHGITELVLLLYHQPMVIKNFFGDGSEFGVHITYVTPLEDFGTAGAVRAAAKFLDERFLIISGDLLTDFDLSQAIRFHEEKGAKATITLTSVKDPLQFGVVITDKEGRITKFLEKPGWGEVFSDTVNTGIYVIEPEVLDHIDPDRPVDFSAEVFPGLLEKGRSLHGHIVDGYWEDVGNPEAYLSAHRDVLSGKVDIDIPGFRIREGVWLGEGADVDPDAVIEGPVIVGDNCRVEEGARLSQFTVLGSDVIVRHDAFVERSVVHDHTYLGPATRLRGCSVG